jgi:hypothetical protein
MEEAAPGTLIYLMPIYEDKQSQNTLKSVFTENFKDELEYLTKQLEDMISSEGTRGSTFEKRLNQYKELRTKAETYEDLLSFKAQDIRKAISDLESKVKSAMTA